MSEAALQRFYAWRKARKHLPPWLRSDSNQDHYFMHLTRMWNDKKPFGESIAFQTVAVLIIDYFLWNIAAHGYTLQKTEKQFKGMRYLDIKKTLRKSEDKRDEERMAFYEAVIGPVRDKQKEGR